MERVHFDQEFLTCWTHKVPANFARQNSHTFQPFFPFEIQKRNCEITRLLTFEPFPTVSHIFLKHSQVKVYLCVWVPVLCVCVYINNYVCVSLYALRIVSLDIFLFSLPNTNTHLKDHALYKYYITVIINISCVPL